MSPSAEAGLRLVAVHICELCLDGTGGECHVPGCVFWCCPAPNAEQAEAIRRAMDTAEDVLPDPDRAVNWGLPWRDSSGAIDG